MEQALEEVEFLARSSNRVAVLELLADGGRTRKELAAKTGVSQATLGRILRDFQQREWVTQDGSTYHATPTGKLIASGLRDFTTTLDIEQRLRDIVTYLPEEFQEFDLRQLADATVVTPSRIRPDAPLQRLLELLDGASDVVAVSHTFNEQALAVVTEQTTGGTMTFEGILSQGAIDQLVADPDLREQFSTLVSHETVTIRVRPEVSVAIMLIDETVCFLIRDQAGILRASIDTEAEAIRSWASTKIEHAQETAEFLSSMDLEEQEDKTSAGHNH